jgi:hypothetical protein
MDNGVVGHLMESRNEIQDLRISGLDGPGKGGEEDRTASILAEVTERMRLDKDSIEGLGDRPRRVQTVRT